jgi:Ras family protein T1
LCYVLGATGSGKTSLLRSFVNRNRGEEYEPTTKVLSVVNSVEMEGVEKYLVVSCSLLVRGLPADIAVARVRVKV